MGQKVHPRGLRLGIVYDWDSRWFAPKKVFPEYLEEDHQVRAYLKRQLYGAGVSRVEIERFPGRIKVYIHTGKPGVVIGRGGAAVDQLRRELEARTGKKVSIDIREVRSPDTDAQLVAESVAAALEKRVSFKRAMKQAVSRAMRQGARGVKVMVSGRLGGAEMHRREWYAEGTVPLHTLRAEVDYGFAEAKTTYGQIGVKVWVHRPPERVRPQGPAPGRERAPGRGERSGALPAAAGSEGVER
jgi:small subunit ribosomal protein S3